MPLPIVEASGEEVWLKHTNDGDPDPTTPWGAACLWWQGLDDPAEYRHALDQLSNNPAAWGDYTEAASLIAHLSILTKVEDNPDRADIKYVRFIDFSGAEAGRVFEAAPLHDVWVVTVVGPDSGGWWRVWGLSHNYFPPASQVLGTD